MGGRLTEKQSLALTALLSGADVEQAAAKANVHRATIWRWRTEPGPFRDALFAAQTEALSRVSRFLAQSGPHAVVVLTGLLRDEQEVTRKGKRVKVQSDVPYSVRARAALGLLREMREFAGVTALEERIAALEAELGEGEPE